MRDSVPLSLFLALSDPLHRSKRGREKERERERDGERENERKKDREMKNMAALKIMTGALAPFSYLVNKSCCPWQAFSA
jgi:hypothetical protein